MTTAAGTARAETAGGPGGAYPVAANPAGLFRRALAAVSTPPLIRFGFRDLAAEWARPEFSRGPAIPALRLRRFVPE